MNKLKVIFTIFCSLVLVVRGAEEVQASPPTSPSNSLHIHFDTLSDPDLDEYQFEVVSRPPSTSLEQLEIQLKDGSKKTLGPHFASLFSSFALTDNTLASSLEEAAFDNPAILVPFNENTFDDLAAFANCTRGAEQARNLSYLRDGSLTALIGAANYLKLHDRQGHRTQLALELLKRDCAKTDKLLCTFSHPVIEAALRARALQLYHGNSKLHPQQVPMELLIESIPEEQRTIIRQADLWPHQRTTFTISDVENAGYNLAVKESGGQKLLRLKNMLLTSGSGLSTHPDAQHVEALDLTQNRLETTSEINFEEFPALIGLFLANNRLSIFNAGGLGQCQHLTKLNLAGNQLTFKQSDTPFVGLHYLKQLFLCKNKIDILPDKLLSGLKVLELISLEGNKIICIPQLVFKGIQGPLTINLRNNLVHEVHQKLFTGSTINEIILTGNPFTIAPRHKRHRDALTRVLPGKITW